MIAVISSPVRIVNAAGLHVRPTAYTVKAYQSEVKLLHRGIEPKSLVTMLSLDVFKSDQIQINANRLDVNAVMIAVSRIFTSGCGED